MIKKLSAIKDFSNLRLTFQTASLLAWFLLSGICYAQTNAQVQVRVFMEGLLKPIPEMVRVDGGEFDIGISDNTPTSPHNQYWRNGDIVTAQTGNVESPRKQITLQSFEVSKHEITREQFKFFLNSSGRSSYHSVWDDPNYYLQQADHPAVYVSWRDARAYVRWLSDETGQGYRLLSESEWEYVARARTQTDYHFGNTISTRQANFAGGNINGTTSVGSYPANDFGLHDVHGNVWEWVRDCFTNNYEDIPNNSNAVVDANICEGSDNRVLRGGAWDSDNPSLLRSAQRGTGSSDRHFNNVGFRIARTISAPQIASPEQNQSFTLGWEDRSLRRMDIPVEINFIKPDTNPIEMTLRLDRGGESVILARPSEPITFPSSGSTRTETFRIIAQSIGATTLTIVVTDGLGNQSETKIRVIVRSISPQMVQVGAGEFNMGSSMMSERPRHPVNIPVPFEVGRYEITREEFKFFLDSSEDITPHDIWNSPAFYQQANHPAAYVSWRDARAYVRWLSDRTDQEYRLLSESEWEYVARARTETNYHFGNTIRVQQANFADSNINDTTSVGSYPANNFELHDVHGNVWEWVQDCWHDNYQGAPTDGSAWTNSCPDRNNYVARGGGWNEPSNNIRSASRTSFSRAIQQNNLGFRIARTLPLTIVNSLADKSYLLLIEGHDNNRRVTLLEEDGDNREEIEDKTLQVQVRVTARRAEVSMELQLEPADNSMSITPASPIIVGPPNQRERTASFMLDAKSPYAYGKTIITIVVTDNSGNTAQVNIPVETIPIPEMVEVPRGRFTMGAVSGDTDASSNERPPHTVNIRRSFYVGKYEVTRGQYRAFASSTGRTKGTDCDWENPGFSQTDNHPVVCVSWNDANAYKNWLQARTGQAYLLLSESQWEYVTRAGRAMQRYSFGNTITTQQANFSGNNINGTTLISRYSANSYGLHDLHGNVWEWVEDCWHANYNNAPNNEFSWGSENGGDCSNRVQRGGGWNDNSSALRSSNRRSKPIGERHNTYGFRMSCSPCTFN